MRLASKVARIWANAVKKYTESRQHRRVEIPAEVFALERARQEVLSATSYFDSVSEPDLVDHAIFLMEAARLKYTYLLKQTRKERIAIPLLDRIVGERRRALG